MSAEAVRAVHRSEALHRALGLTDAEFDAICSLLRRGPNHLELAMYAVMWSEHCSYKSPRVHLARLPSRAPWVLVGPGENAGVVDAGDGLALALRIESHNHPSAIEPTQGAATGVGGILRDVFTMGARPIALADALRFGSFAESRSRWIARGVVGGVSGYGNSVGVPTVAGEFVTCSAFDGNPLVNVAAVGVMPSDRLVLGRADEPGCLAVLLGASTGRDGIGGVSVLASAGFDESAPASDLRPTTQVGDPFEEKRLIEACLELIGVGLVSGIQDLGGAGLTCAASEIASRGGTGMEIDISTIPLREADMAPFEIMTSESQERMLAVVEPASLAAVTEICEGWEVNAAVIGRVTADGMLRIVDGSAPSSAPLAELPAASLHENAPVLTRPAAVPSDLAQRRAVDPLAAADGERSASGPDVAEDLLAMLADPAWAYEQYDHQLFVNTVIGPGADAALLRLRDPQTGATNGHGLGLSVDGNHRWCAADPRRGTAMVVAESVLNLACVGADPLALVNCLNFGNPTHPEVMWQLSEAIDGMSEACEAFGLPVVGGNVSLYNETNGVDIAPTPVVCTIGLHRNLARRPVSWEVGAGQALLMAGAALTGNGRRPVPLGGSYWAWERAHCRHGELPELDLPLAARTAALVARWVRAGQIEAVHDVSEGGAALALAEMACASGIGLRARLPGGAEAVPVLFGEAPGRVIVAASPDRTAELRDEASADGVPVIELGRVAGDRLRIGRIEASADGAADPRYGHRGRVERADMADVGRSDDADGPVSRNDSGNWDIDISIRMVMARRASVLSRILDLDQAPPSGPTRDRPCVDPQAACSPRTSAPVE